MTRDLQGLLADDEGRAFLAARGMYTDPGEFLAALKPPERPELTAELGLASDALLVFVGQQACADYHPAVAAKFGTAMELRRWGVEPVALWHDIDRVESERYGMRFVLPTGREGRGLWLAPRSLGAREARFVPVEQERLEQVFADVHRWVAASRRDGRADRLARVDALADAVLSRPAENLGVANVALAEVLLREQLGVELPSRRLSELLQAGLYLRSMNLYLAALDDVIRVFNEALEELHANEVDVRLRPLTQDYLPLFVSCENCATRSRLRHVRSGPDHFAEAACRCGHEHRYHLGVDTPSLGDLEGSDRWSPDVSLAVHHNALASGCVVGRSSALYGLVFNQVVERALGMDPIPGLVPLDLRAEEQGPDGESLMVEYLTA